MIGFKLIRKTELDQLVSDHVDLQDELEQAQADHEAVKASLKAALEREEYSRADVERISKLCMDVMSERDDVKRKYVRLEEHLRNARDEAAVANDEATKAQEDLDRAHQEITLLLEGAHAVDAERLQLRDAVRDLRDQNDRLTRLVGQMQAEIERLRAKLLSSIKTGDALLAAVRGSDPILDPFPSDRAAIDGYRLVPDYADNFVTSAGL